MRGRRVILITILWLAAGCWLTAAENPPDPPAPRTRAEVDEVLRASAVAPEALRDLRVLLVAGPKTHGPLQHDYPLWQKNWAVLLAKAPRVAVDTAFPWPAPEQWETADVAVFYLRGTWSAEQIDALQAFQARGRGLVFIHWAVGSDDRAPELAERIGLAYPQGKYRHGPVEMPVRAGHPITQGLPARVQLYDEAYWPFVGNAERVNVLGTSDEESDGPGVGRKPVPLYWTFEPAGGGRAFVSIPGHYMWTFDDPLQRLLLLRGIAWAAGEPVTRLDALSLDGARVTP
jgi:type 1 glutamine amidotransferase